MARYIAKNVVAAGLADQCEVQISYAIGVAEPISVLVNTYETGKLPDEKILELRESVRREAADVQRLKKKKGFLGFLGL